MRRPSDAPMPARLCTRLGDQRARESKARNRWGFSWRPPGQRLPAQLLAMNWATALRLSQDQQPSQITADNEDLD